MNLKQRAKQLQKDIPVVVLALKDRDTPIIAKLLAGITIVYACSPIDLIPDFIPLLGYLDDIILLPMLIALTIKFIPKDLWERKKKEIGDSTKQKEKKWYYAIPIICIWLLLLYLLINMFL